MFNHRFALLRRHRRLLAPLLAAIVAGAVVAGVSLATDSTPSSKSAPAGALALQDGIVKVVQSVSPSVVQIEDQTGLGSGVVFDAAGSAPARRPQHCRSGRRAQPLRSAAA